MFVLGRPFQTYLFLSVSFSDKSQTNGWRHDHGPANVGAMVKTLHTLASYVQYVCSINVSLEVTCMLQEYCKRHGHICCNLSYFLLTIDLWVLSCNLTSKSHCPKTYKYKNWTLQSLMEDQTEVKLGGHWSGSQSLPVFLTFSLWRYQGAFPGCKRPFPGCNWPFPGWKRAFPRHKCAFPGCQGYFPGCTEDFPGSQGVFYWCQGSFPGSQGAFSWCYGVFPVYQRAFWGCQGAIPKF